MEQIDQIREYLLGTEQAVVPDLRKLSFILSAPAGVVTSFPEVVNLPKNRGTFYGLQLSVVAVGDVDINASVNALVTTSIDGRNIHERASAVDYTTLFQDRDTWVPVVGFGASAFNMTVDNTAVGAIPIIVVATFDFSQLLGNSWDQAREVIKKMQKA